LGFATLSSTISNHIYFINYNKLGALNFPSERELPSDTPASSPTPTKVSFSFVHLFSPPPKPCFWPSSFLHRRSTTQPQCPNQCRNPKPFTTRCSPSTLSTRSSTVLFCFTSVRLGSSRCGWFNVQANPSRTPDRHLVHEVTSPVRCSPPANLMAFLPANKRSGC
jgi:hypothetical protein